MKSRTKKFLIVGVVLCLCMVVGGFAAFKGYKAARHARLVKKAKTYLAEGKDRNALLCLQGALKFNSQDIEVCRMLAELHEKGRSPGALIWRGKVVELNPDSLDDRLALVTTAMQLRDISAATNALEGVNEAGRQTAAYHNLAGTLASSLGEIPKAETHFAEASRIDPLNPAPQLNLAILRLRNTNAVVSDQARSTLKALSSNTTNAHVASVALRELTGDAMRRRDLPAAFTLSSALLQQTNATFSDRVLRLEVLNTARSPELAPTLAEFQHLASTQAAHIYEIATWQMGRQGPAVALGWLTTLPGELQTNQPLALLVADCLAQGNKWHDLQVTIQPQNWGDLEFIRHAYLSRAFRAQDMESAAKGEWELALKDSRQGRDSMAMLLRLAAQWRWATEAEELLWAIVNRYPTERWAVQSLTQSLYANGRSRPLLTLFSQELRRDPNNLALKNNLAVLGLLLEANELKPHDLAREVYTAAPTNSAFISTYALSLHLQDKNPEALKLMQTIPQQKLEDPSIAGYYGLVLRATGDNARAATYLNWAFKGALLPEERKLFERAKAGV